MIKTVNSEKFGRTWHQSPPPPDVVVTDQIHEPGRQPRHFVWEFNRPVLFKFPTGQKRWVACRLLRYVGESVLLNVATEFATNI